MHSAIIVSDIHLGLRDSKCDLLQKFLQENPCELLILNGDIVDGWALGRGASLSDKHKDFLAYLIRLSETTKIIWLMGNHDDFLQPFLNLSLSNIEIRREYVLEARGKKYLVFHGDIIDAFIQQHKWLSHLGSLGYDFALWLNRWYNRYRSWSGKPYKSIAQWLKNKVKAATNHINNFEETAIRLALSKGCTGAICGHIHYPNQKWFFRNGNVYTYYNSGDFIENNSFIVLKDAKFELSRINYKK